jgi:citrate lyase alpha subunit
MNNNSLTGAGGLIVGIFMSGTDNTNIDNDQLSIIIAPDIRMKINAASPWAHSVLLFIAAVFCGSEFIKKTFFFTS